MQVLRWLVVGAVIGAAGCGDNDQSRGAIQAVECIDGCDCFDDNPCTNDVCVDNACVVQFHDGGCGSTVGTCRLSSCCTSEFTCFRAYDNDSICKP